VTVAELGRALTAAQNAVDAAGRLVALQQRITAATGEADPHIEAQLRDKLTAMQATLRHVADNVDRYAAAPVQERLTLTTS